MVDYILPDDMKNFEKGNGKTLIVYTADKNGDGDTYTASDSHEVDMPIAILVNENSASASEVFTGALKDYKKAVVVGTTSYGKGIVQNLIRWEMDLPLRSPLPIIILQAVLTFMERVLPQMWK